MDDYFEDAETQGGLSADITDQLAELDDHELRLVIHHAQAVLAERYEGPPEIEPLPGEEILRVTEYAGYTAIVKRQPCDEGCDECPHGPYLYHVTREPRYDGERSLKWRYLGPIRERR